MTRTQKRETMLEETDILSKMNELRGQIRLARLQFNQAVEPELVDACVYEISALQARYDFYLRRAREMNVETTYARQPAARL
ncbi:MAG: YaaL family protein [Oscillospiraceae bacterium]|nr:YaaL family protein [Oscillospiraceae bacterium]